MTPIGAYGLCIMFGLSIGILIGYYFHWREYQPLVGFAHAARHQALKEKFERGELHGHAVKVAEEWNDRQGEQE
jgi:hypothetical protein